MSLFSFILLFIALFVVIISSYTSLIVIERMLDETRIKKMIWLTVTAFIFSIGVFCMHIIAIIASNILLPLSYNSLLLFLSFLSCFVASFVSIYIIQLNNLSVFKGFLSGIFLGLGILFLHYLSLKAINELVIINYNSIFFYLSILFSFILLWVSNKAIELKKKYRSLSITQNVTYAATIGVLIFCLHMFAMEATTIIEKHSFHTGFQPVFLGIVLSIVSILIMVITHFSVFVDYRMIQKEKQLLNQLKLSENRYRTLVEKSPYPVLVHDENTILFANKAALLLFEATKLNQLVNKPTFDYFHPDYRKLMMKRKE